MVTAQQAAGNSAAVLVVEQLCSLVSCVSVLMTQSSTPNTIKSSTVTRFMGISPLVSLPLNVSPPGAWVLTEYAENVEYVQGRHV